MRRIRLILSFLGFILIGFLNAQEFDPWKQHAEQRIDKNPDALFESYLDSASAAIAFAKQVDYLNKAIAAAENAGIKEDIVTGNYFLAKAYHEQGDTEYAKAHFEKAANILKEFDSDEKLLEPKLEAKIYYDAGINYSYQSNHPKALHYFTLTEKMSKQYGLDSLLAISLRQIGNVYYYLGELSKSSEYYHQSLEKSQAMGMHHAIASSLSNIGGNLDEMGRTDEAKEFYERGLKIAQQRNIPELVAIISNNMGVLYSGTEDYDKAIDNFNMALSYAVKNNDIIGKATYYNNIADVYLNKDDFERARDFAGRSMKFNEQIGNKEGLSTNYMIFSYLMTELKKYDSAWYYIRKLDTLAQEQPNPSIVQGYYSTLYNYYNQREEYEQALDTYIKLTDIYDSVRDAQNEEKIANLTAVTQERERQKENEILKEQKEQLKNSIYLIGVLSLLMISAVIYAFVVQRKATNRIKQQNEQLRNSKRELTHKNAELNQSRKMLEQVNKDRNQLFSIISHDLRSPFNSLLGFSEMLIEETEDEDADRESIVMMSQNIYASSMQLFELIQNLLEWANKERGKIEFHPEEIILHRVAQDNIKLARQSAQLKEVKIHNQIDKHVMIEGDINMLNTIMRNLIFNSVKFTPKNGNIKIFTRYKANYVTISIEDNGIGMSEADRNKILHSEETFTRKGTENEKGAGLGLVLTKDFIKRHQGSFDITTKEGEGTTFHITLPIKQNS